MNFFDQEAEQDPFHRLMDELSSDSRQRVIQESYKRQIAPEDPAWILVELLVNTEKVRE